MPHVLPQLPYAFNALEPYIDAQTMEIHHGKHHQAYVNNLNNALAGTGLEETPLHQLIADLSKVPEAKRMAVRNNGGGHANHSFFWELMKPGGAKEPAGDLASAINGAFGSFATFKEQFAAAGLGRFGSGWAWLVVTGGKLVITSTPNQDSPLMKGVADVTGTPILGLDVWEHAYYLKYQNRRPDYIAAWWNVVNWDVVAGHFKSAK
ncbi:MAG TPA: superoxide dismutase [bacterium]|nr:superoxide dismutase [bacterium]